MILLDHATSTGTTGPIGVRVFQLALLAISTWAVAYCRFEIAPIQEALQKGLHFSDNQIAWLQGPATAIPIAMASILTGFIVDRYQRKILFPVAIGLAIAATIWVSEASSFVAIAAARCMTGLSIAIVLIASYATACDLFPPRQRGRAMMALTLSEVVGGPAAFALGGFLLAYHHETSVVNWRWSLLWMIAPLAPVLVLALLIREPARLRSSPTNVPLARQVCRGLWSHRAVIAPLLLARIMVWIADGAVLVWGAPTLARNFGLGPAKIGAILGASLLFAGIIGPTIGGPFADMLQRTGGPRYTMSALCGLGVASIGAAFFAIMPTPALTALMLTGFLVVGYVIAVLATALATIVIPAEVRPSYIALQITVGALFSIGVAPLAVSVLSDTLGGGAMIGRALGIVCAVGSIVTAISFGLGVRALPHPDQHKESGPPEPRFSQ